MAFDSTNPDHLVRLRDLIRADPDMLAHANAGRDNQIGPHFSAASGQKIDKASVHNADLLAAIYRDGETWTAENTTTLALLLVPPEAPMSTDIKTRIDEILADKPIGQAGFVEVRQRDATVAEVEWGEGSTITTADVSASLRPDRPDGRIA